MIPIKDTQRSRTRPYVNWILIFINLSIFAYELSLSDRALAEFTLKYGVVPAVITNPSAFSQADLARTSGLLGLVTSLLIHVGWVHALGNMLYLWIFGDNVEDLMGHGRYLAFYFLVGITASAAHILADPTSAVPTVWGQRRHFRRVPRRLLVNFPRSRILCAHPDRLFMPWSRFPSIVLPLPLVHNQPVLGVASIGAQA